MLVKRSAGRYAGETVEMPYHVARRAIASGSATAAEGDEASFELALQVLVPEPEPSAPEVAAEAPAAAPVRRRGRPAGSRNKPRG